MDNVVVAETPENVPEKKKRRRGRGRRNLSYYKKNKLSRMMSERMTKMWADRRNGTAEEPVKQNGNGTKYITVSFEGTVVRLDASKKRTYTID